MQRCRQEIPRFELQLARVIVTIFDTSFDGGSVLQKPPYALSVELPILDESEIAFSFGSEMHLLLAESMPSVLFHPHLISFQGQVLMPLANGRHTASNPTPPCLMVPTPARSRPKLAIRLLCKDFYRLPLCFSNSVFPATAARALWPQLSAKSPRA
jgi:hypothetical protein